MRHSYRFQGISILFAAMFVYSCSLKPTEQITRTENAKQTAKAEYAEQFAAEDWGAAEQAWAQAQDLLGQKKYGDATRVLLKAKTRYDKARELAQGKREDTVREIKGLQKTAELRCKSLRDNIEKSTGKIPAAAKKVLEDRCKEIDDKIAKIVTTLDGGQFNDAKLLAQTTLRDVWESEKDLQDYLAGKKRT